MVCLVALVGFKPQRMIEVSVDQQTYKAQNLTTERYRTVLFGLLRGTTFLRPSMAQLVTLKLAL